MQAKVGREWLTTQPSFLLFEGDDPNPKTDSFSSPDRPTKTVTFETDGQQSLFSYWDHEEAKFLGRLKEFVRIASHEERLTDTTAWLVVTTLVEEFDYVRRRCEASNITRLVPRSKARFLDRHFPSFVGEDDEILSFAIHLADQGKTRVGDVVQLPRSDVEAMMLEKPEVFQRLECRLENIGLSFNMSAPWWKSPGGLYRATW